MTENMKKFLELVSQNEELGKKLRSVDKEGLISAAKELGVELAEADFVQNNELDDDELDVVAGGKDCYCAVGGGGEKGENKEGKDNVCACVAAGVGYGYNYYGVFDTITGEHSTRSEKEWRCYCELVGYGNSCL